MDKFLDAIHELPPNLQTLAIHCYLKLDTIETDLVDELKQSEFYDCDYAFVTGMVIGYITGRRKK